MRLQLRPHPSLLLKPGVYVLPGHFTVADVEGTAKLVCDLLPGIHRVERIAGTRRGASGSGAGASEDVIAIFDALGEGGDDREESIVAQLQAVGYPYVLARIPGAAPEASRWLERTLKPATVSALRHAIQLSAVSAAQRARGVELVREASALSNEPFELRWLVEAALVRDVPDVESDQPADVRSQLDLAAGARLVERLTRLEGAARRASVVLLLSGGEGDPYDTDFRLGAEALQGIGLATYRHGSVALGPLARAVVSKQGVRDTLIRLLPRDAWSSRAIGRIDDQDDSSENAFSVVLDERNLNRQDRPVDALILTVLSEEHNAVMNASQPWSVRPERIDAGPGAGLDLVVVEGYRPLRIVVAQVRELGGFASQRTAKELIHVMRPALVATCGICSGVSDELNIADIIVADAVIRSDGHTRYVRDKASLKSDVIYRLRPDWQRKAELFSNSHAEFSGRVHIGTLATGIEALRGSDAISRLRMSHHRVLGFEFEAETLHTVASEDAIVVRGVSDLADGSKRGEHHEAARAAASWLVEFLRESLS